MTSEIKHQTCFICETGEETIKKTTATHLPAYPTGTTSTYLFLIHVLMSVGKALTADCTQKRQIGEDENGDDDDGDYNDDGGYDNDREYDDGRDYDGGYDDRDNGGNDDGDNNDGDKEEDHTCEYMGLCGF
ncbi:UNVERIFIED_CONTAM: hypothetical protein K2H54_045187 [Gekko kuhli]